MPITRRSSKSPNKIPDSSDPNYRYDGQRYDSHQNSISKADHLNEESKIIEDQLKNISDDLYGDEMMTQDQLVKLKMNFSSLNDYLKNIIKVINQHAKLLNTLNQEIQVRTTEKQIGDMFSLISAGIPYDTLVKKIGGNIPPRRGSVLKLLGDTTVGQSYQQRQSSQDDQYSFIGQQSILEGTEKFLKMNEMVGKYLLDLKEYQHSTDCQISRIDKEFSQRVTKIEFNAVLKEKTNKLKNTIRDEVSCLNNKQLQLEKKMQEDYETLTKKIADLEQNTLWKINDYEKLLQTRVNETYMKDYVKGEIMKQTREQKEFIERNLFPLDKKNEHIQYELNQTKERIEEERKNNQIKIHQTKGELEQRLDELLKQDDTIKDQLKKMSNKMKEMEKERSEMINNLKKGMGNGPADQQQYDLMRNENEHLEKKIKKMTKGMKELKEKYDNKITRLEMELSKKAEKEAIIENQQKFFDNLHKMENETDENITKVVGDELKKLGEQISTQSKVIDKKMAKLQQDIDIDKINKAVDKKIGREEAKNMIENQDSKYLQLEKQYKQLKAQLERLENLVENLALAIKNLELNAQSRGSNNTALIRQTTIHQDKVQCLSCGQQENITKTPPNRSKHYEYSNQPYPDTHVSAIEFSPPGERNPVQVVSELSHHDDSRVQKLSNSNSQVIDYKSLRPLSSNIRQVSQAYTTNPKNFPQITNNKSKSNNISFGGNQNIHSNQKLNQSYTGSFHMRNNIKINKNNTAQIRGGPLNKILGIKNEVQGRPKSKGGIGLIDDPSANVERVFRHVE